MLRGPRRRVHVHGELLPGLDRGRLRRELHQQRQCVPLDLLRKQRLRERFFLVAEGCTDGADSHVLGFIIGEVRAWEFGSTPCGWVFALSVEPEMRLQSVATELFEAISNEFKKAGVGKMRTMVARDAHLPMLFFRSEGMMAGPYIQLEKDLD